MAQKIVAGNWKMNLNLEQALQLGQGLSQKIKPGDVRVILFPPSLYIHALGVLNEGSFEVGAQNFYPKNEGAYTGELSLGQLKSVGSRAVLIGHSERRAYFREDNDFLKAKVNEAVANNLDFIFCCGEPEMIRGAGKELEFVRTQLMESLFHLTGEQLNGKIIAYEPVWAIGTGLTATSEQAENMHANIRFWISEKYGPEVATTVSILYGGSCNPKNAKELFACPNVDGGLIGGSSLNVEEFCSIIDSY